MPQETLTVTKCFVKILQKQESGYSGDKPNQRGPYILIPKECLLAFPHLTNQEFNSFVAIRCLLPTGSETILTLKYNNAKFFLDSQHTRDHDETRLYWNNELRESLGLDKHVLIVFIPIGPLKYATFSLRETDSEYAHWKKYHKKLVDLSEVENEPNVKNALKRADHAVSDLGKNIQYALDFAQKFKEENKKNGRVQQEAAAGDPAAALSSLFSNQEDFRDYVREMYGYKCALRGRSLIKGMAFGLDAAHIKPDQHGGPLLPTNGILLSKDLHHAFEAGAFSLDSENKVIVNPLVSKESEVQNFAGVEIKPQDKFSLFRPFSSYVTHHRERLFQEFST